MTPNEILKSKLTPEEYEIVMSAWRAKLAQNNPTAAIKGAVKSWTVWLGSALVALPELVPLLAPHLQDMLTPDLYKRVMQIFGLLVILVRFRTTQPLSAKGTPNA